MVDETIQEMPIYSKRVALLATNATVQSGIYQEALSTLSSILSGLHRYQCVGTITQKLPSQKRGSEEEVVSPDASRVAFAYRPLGVQEKGSQNQEFKRLHHFYVNRTQLPLTKKQSLREISQIMHSYFFKEIPRISATVCRLSRFTLTNCVIFALFFCLIASCSSSYLP